MGQGDWLSAFLTRHGNPAYLFDEAAHEADAVAATGHAGGLGEKPATWEAAWIDLGGEG